MTECVMFEAVYSDVCGLSSAHLHHLMLIFGERYRFQMAACQIKASTGGERDANLFLHFLRRSTSTGLISLRHRFTQPSN